MRQMAGITCEEGFIARRVESHRYNPAMLEMIKR